jgi:hypothetical protein
MPARSSRLTVGLRISSKLKRFQGAGIQAAYDLAFEMAEDAQKYAKENVEPGHGPSPHDGDADKWGHRWPHTDWGDLQESIQISVGHQGFLGIAQVYTDEDYGAWLEIGFHSPAGNFFRYPWLSPAFERVIRESASDLPEKLIRRLTETGSKTAGAVEEAEIKAFIRKEELEHFQYTEE